MTESLQKGSLSTSNGSEIWLQSSLAENFLKNPPLHESYLKMIVGIILSYKCRGTQDPPRDPLRGPFWAPVTGAMPPPPRGEGSGKGARTTPPAPQAFFPPPLSTVTSHAAFRRAPWDGPNHRPTDPSPNCEELHFRLDAADHLSCGSRRVPPPLMASAKVLLQGASL